MPPATPPTDADLDLRECFHALAAFALLDDQMPPYLLLAATSEVSDDRKTFFAKAVDHRGCVRWPHLAAKVWMSAAHTDVLAPYETSDSVGTLQASRVTERAPLVLDVRKLVGA